MNKEDLQASYGRKKVPISANNRRVKEEIMLNILSYQTKVFTGREILAWAHYQVDNQTALSRLRQAKRILSRFGNINPDRKYVVIPSYGIFGRGRGNKKVVIMRYNEV